MLSLVFVHLNQTVYRNDDQRMLMNSELIDIISGQSTKILNGLKKPQCQQITLTVFG